MGSTLAQLETRARYRAKLENSNFVTSTEWARLLNEGYRELWNLVRLACGDHFVSSFDFTLTTTNSYSFAAAVTDFGRLRGVDRINGTATDDIEHLDSFRWDERSRQLDRRYRLMGQVIYIEPATMAEGSYRVWYEPRVTELSAGLTVSPIVDEWEEYIVLYAAIAALDEEESDASALRLSLYGGRDGSGMRGDILALAGTRDSANPERIRDVYSDPRRGVAPRLPAP